MTANAAALTKADLDQEIARTAQHIRAKNEALVVLGRELGMMQLVGRDGSDFIRLAYGATMHREPSSAEIIKDQTTLARGMSKLEFLRGLRFSAEGRRVASPSHRLVLRLLQIRHRLTGWLRPDTRV